MITPTKGKVIVSLDDDVKEEMLQSMADGLCAIQEGGIVHTGYKPYCIGGCCLAWGEETARWIHAEDCLLAQAIGVAHCCPEVLSNLKMIDECLGVARQEVKTLSAERENMNEEPTIHKFNSVPPLCPYCEDRGKRNALTPKGSKLECPVCGNVFWAKDPIGANSRNEVPQ